MVLEVELQASGNRVLGNGKVDEGEAAQADGCLVHEAAGLAKVDVLGKLTHARHLEGVIAASLPEGLHRTSQRCLDRCGRGEPPAHGDGASHGKVKACRGAPVLGHPERHAPYQRSCGVLLSVLGVKRVEGDLDGGVSVACQAHHAQAVGAGECVYSHVQGTRDNVAPFVVGVVAGNL